MKNAGIFFAAVLLIVSGCHRQRPRVLTALPPVAPVVVEKSPEKPPEPPPPPVAEPPPALPVVDPLEKPDRDFDAGKYADAAQGYQDYLASDQSGDHRDHALFQMAMTYVMGPNTDWTHAVPYLRQLVETCPDSPLKVPASVILSLQAEMAQTTLDAQRLRQEVRRLNSEIEQMKRIDADRRKRP